LSIQELSLDSGLILDRISDGFFELDGQWHFIHLNKRAAALAPHRPEALIGKSIWKVFPETVGTVVCTEFHRAVESQIPVCFPYYALCFKRWYEVNAYPNGEGLTVFFHDATDEHKALEARETLQRAIAFRAEVSNALSQSDVPLDAILQDCAEAVVRHVDVALARIWLVNETQKVLELHASAGISTDLTDPHTRIPVGTSKIGRIALTGLPESTNHVQTDPSICDREWAEREGLISFAGHPLSLAGKVIGVLVVFACHRFRQNLLDNLSYVATVITRGIEQKRTEQAFRDSEETLRLAAEATELGTWDWDLTTDVLALNARTRIIFGLPPEGEPSYELFLEMIHPDDRERVHKTIEHSLDPGSNGNYDIEYRVVRQDGVLKWVKEKGQVSFKGKFPDRAPVRFVGTVIDITDAKRKEEELREANKAKDEFLATLSHELRTPLTSIYGWANLLHAGQLDRAGSMKAYEVIERNVKAQMQLVDDLLNVSSIIVGKVKLVPKWLDPVPTIDAAVESIRPAAEVKGLHVHAQSNGPVLIFADPDRLQQVISNLLNNAMKFTEKGGEIKVDFGRVQNSFHINVRDTGEGISPEFLPHVFDQFRQADASTTRKHGGLGLGLNIVRRLTEMHGGSVAAHSEGKGKGTTMTIRLPLPPLPRLPLDGHRKPDSLHGLTVLVIEGEQDTLCILGQAVQACGAAVILATSAADALAQLNQRKPDVLISDVAMPDMDGCQLIRAIRSELPPESKDIPAVALSNNGSAADRNKLFEAGYRAHVSKPVVVQDLVTILAGLTRRKRYAARVHGD
jgi:PAS domain S-box-containing protein